MHTLKTSGPRRRDAELDDFCARFADAVISFNGGVISRECADFLGIPAERRGVVTMTANCDCPHHGQAPMTAMQQADRDGFLAMDQSIYGMTAAEYARECRLRAMGALPLAPAEPEPTFAPTQTPPGCVEFDQAAYLGGADPAELRRQEEEEMRARRTRFGTLDASGRPRRYERQGNR